MVKNNKQTRFVENPSSLTDGHQTTDLNNIHRLIRCNIILCSEDLKRAIHFVNVVFFFFIIYYNLIKHCFKYMLIFDIFTISHR